MHYHCGYQMSLGNGHHVVCVDQATEDAYAARTGIMTGFNTENTENQ